ncbi:hypothetical protein NTE_03489 [Candidatus Nitrososphaera evergladensis SR1]|uniref:Uncharacterized protein n=1 Tax=Candidatus Nitrososphaera evergladensis SR1 TaxID=1459636 RepID=A0A075MXZ7_9ARCH|nr:hypothetical protein [Candidatus Nitrososphaera evergladensis]AIF85517.1 hypothetical protein NTE_03489 [Candidatus Nitrososphaera evergladensis SR1]
MMWFNNQYGYVYLMNHAVNPSSYKVTKIVIEGWISMGYQCVIEKIDKAC